MNMNMSKKSAYIKATITVTAWGASFIATKVALRDISPVTIVWLRFAIGILIIGAVIYRRKQLSLPSLADLGSFALLGAIGITFHQWLQSTGLVTAEATTTAWIVATTPIFIALLGWLVLKEKLAGNALIGILLAAGGVILVVSKGDLTALSGGNFGTYGDMLVLISAPNWAIFSVLSRKSLQKHPAALMMFYVMLFGWLFTSVQLYLGPGLSEIQHMTTASWSGVAFLGILCTGIAYIFWYDALTELEANKLGAFLYLEPLVAMLVAAIILDENIVMASIIGGVFILSGVWLVNKINSQPEPA